MKKRTVQAGIDRLGSSDTPDFLPWLGKSAKVGLITNPTGITKNCTPTYEILREKYDLCALFSPEHGVRGDLQAGVPVEETVDSATGIRGYSTYGTGRERAYEVMRSLDAVFFDIQDIGSRYYTYQYTMTDAMKVCAGAKVPFIVLDRPPVIGCVPQGNILDRRFSSGVGKFPVAARTGLTVGEFAQYINASEGLGCTLTVIPCGNITRSTFLDETDLPFVNPSPNLPSVDCALIYVGACLIEGTNLSEGRGTTRPFELIGAPWLRSRSLIDTLNRQPHDGCLFRETYFTPTFSKHQDELCAGIQIHVTDRQAFRPFDLALRMIAAIREQNPEFEFLKTGVSHLFGSDAILADDFDPEEYLRSCEAPLAEYAEAIRSFFLYE